MGMAIEQEVRHVTSNPLGALAEGIPHRRDKGADPEHRAGGVRVAAVLPRGGGRGKAARRRATAPRIRGMVGVLRGEYLLVETEGTVEGKPPKRWTTLDHGLLRVSQGDPE